MSNIFDKYDVIKKDGSPIDLNAQYFVLRIDTDPAARFALHAYARFIAQSDSEFSNELFAWVAEYESNHTGWSCEHCGWKNKSIWDTCFGCGRYCCKKL